MISYFEDADKAFSDLFGAATYRVTGNTYDNGGVVPPSTEILWDYLTIHTKLFMHFGFSVLYYSLAGILIVSVLGIATSYQSTIRLVLGIFLSLVVSSGWVMVMPQYAAQHWHFIPRHYFLSVFFTTISILIVAGKLKIQKNQLA